MTRDLIFEVSTKTVTNKYNVSIPTPRQIIQIEGEKTVLTSGLYRDIMASNTLGASYALDVVDMHAYFTVLMPELINDMKIGDRAMVDMDLMEFNNLKNQYSKQFVPWVNGWMKILNAPVEELPPIDVDGDKGSDTDGEIVNL